MPVFLHLFLRIEYDDDVDDDDDDNNDGKCNRLIACYGPGVLCVLSHGNLHKDPVRQE